MCDRQCVKWYLLLKLKCVKVTLDRYYKLVLYVNDSGGEFPAAPTAVITREQFTHLHSAAALCCNAAGVGVEYEGWAGGPHSTD